MAFNDVILAKAKALLLRNLSSVDEGVLADCCKGAFSELAARLRDDVTPELVEDCFLRAAGCLAAASYIEIDTRQFENFSAAGVSSAGRSAEETRASADALRRQAELMMIGFLKDREFAFKAVRG